METYVVQPGDTIDDIALRFGISADKLIIENELTDPNQLVPGEVIVITFPSQTYTVLQGDTLESIAASFNISVSEILRNNPFVANIGAIYPGEVLTISYNRIGSVATHGYTNTFISRNILRKTLPYLTYLSIFNYRTVENGELSGSNADLDIIEEAKEYGVIPLMLMTALSVQGEVDMELVYRVLIDEEVENRLFENVLRTVRENGYYGVNLSAQFITEENQNLFYTHTRKLSEMLRQEGYQLHITFNPRIETVNKEVSFEIINYEDFANLVDTMIFLQYKWGISSSPPAPVISLSNLSIFLDYEKSLISNEQIYTGIPLLGYIWELPYMSGLSDSNSITVDNAINLAREVGAVIQFDEVSQTPYFTIADINTSIQYVVWFVNAITVDSFLKLILEKGIYGTGVWNIMTYFAQLWLVMNSQYEIIKLLPEL